MTFTRHEIFVIKACKLHFKAMTGKSAFGTVQQVIDRMVYGNEDGNTPNYIILGYLRGILLKARPALTAQGWEAITMQMIYEVERDAQWNGEPFLEKFLDKHFSAVQGLQVRDGKETLIDLDITPEEEKEVEIALGKE